MTTKKQRIFMGLAIGLIIVIFAYSFTMSTQIGGSAWGYDYQWKDLRINGEIITFDVPGSYDPIVYTELEGDFGVTFDVRPNNYEWWSDVDGDPIYDGATWLGLAPDIGLGVSLPWRMDVNGEKIPAQYEDPNLVTHTYTGSVVAEYYYGFDTLVKTKQDSFTVPGTIQSGFEPWTSAECGTMEVDATLLVIIKMNNPELTQATFADAKVLDVEVGDLQLQSGLEWAVAPKVAVMQDQNQALPILNAEDGEDYYTCEIQFLCTLTPGLVHSGRDLLPYEVWVRKTVQMTLLLDVPLDVGSTGEPIDPIDPPIFTKTATWLDYLILILIIIAIIAVCVVAFKFAGAFTIIAGAWASRK